MNRLKPTPDAAAPPSPESLPRPTREPRRLRADLDAFGYCFVADALAAAHCQMLIERVKEQAEREAQALDVPFDRTFTSVDNLLAKGQCFQDLILHPAVGDLIAHLLGDDYLLSLFEARAVGPRHGAQALHSDPNFVPGRTKAAFIATALWMLVDFTEEERRDANHSGEPQLDRRSPGHRPRIRHLEHVRR